ncbi:CYTH domain-containing protein [Nitrobacter sp. JJSN]|uniref:CYTH domain-containing protein n=1 Tax=Nitrobacter sp. JJSN TaxID=3453033 RepID=UPI003F761606
MRKSFKRGQAQALDSVYFDTTEQHLHKAAFSLRIRHTGKRRVQTLKAVGKATAGLFVRPEWERDIESDIPALLQQFIPEPVLADLRPIFRTVVRRNLFEAIERGGCSYSCSDRCQGSLCSRSVPSSLEHRHPTQASAGGAGHP